MKYAAFLPQGGTIGFVAPSFGCVTEPYHTAFLHALERWTGMGYRIDPGPNCFAARGVGISNTPDACAKEFMEYYLSPDNDCLISCGGGELMCEILDDIDFDALRNARPKWFMGFSDNTNLTFLLATLCDTASIYGPCAATFGMEPWHSSVRDAWRMLNGKQRTVHGYKKWEREKAKGEENPLAPYQVTEKRILKSYLGKGKGLWEEAGPDALSFEGRLLGGCMDCLVNLLGTKYDRVEKFTEKYRKDGIIWFLEACDLNVFGIRRAMWQMEHAGWFQHVKGFLIGRPACFGQDEMGLDAYAAVMQIASAKQVPVIMDVDLGHLPPMMPLMVGSLARVTVQENDISVKMRLG